jgi:aconitate decarboxylase
MIHGLTRRFVDLLCAWPANDPVLLERCRLLIVDGLAVAAAGAHEPGPTALAALARADRAAGAATVIGQGFVTAASSAARINGMAMHVLDFEPMWNPPNHAISPLLPALLALAEEREARAAGAQGAAVLRALAIGIEAQGRLRLSSGQLEPAQLSLHPPGVVGPIAAALACADLLGLDAEQATMAIGIAASRSGGLLANVGSHTKALHCGDAAAHGLEAALLAEAGFGANDDALGSPRGWGRAFFGAGFDAEALLVPIGRGRALDPGPSWKLFPSQFATHFAITAALDARARLGAFEASDVARIELRVPAMPYIDRPAPGTGLEGKFSWQYTTALALLDGQVGVATFTDQRRRADDVDAVLKRLVLVADPEISGLFDAMHVVLTVELVNGSVVTTRCASPLGSWLRPVDAERILDKARGLLTGAIGQDATRSALTALAQPAARLCIGDVMATLAQTRAAEL